LGLMSQISSSYNSPGTPAADIIIILRALAGFCFLPFQL
jgi:hypothetical protein